MRLAKASNTNGRSGAFILCECSALNIVLVEVGDRWTCFEAGRGGRGVVRVDDVVWLGLGLGLVDGNTIRVKGHETDTI